MTEPKWLVLTEARKDQTDGRRCVAGSKQHVAVRHILRFYKDPHVRGGDGTVVVFATHLAAGEDWFYCLESVETIEAWLAGKPAPAPALPKRATTIYPIESLYGRSMAVVAQAIRRFDPTATGVEGPGTGEITVECEERHRAVIDELFKPPPGASKPLDGEKQGS